MFSTQSFTIYVIILNLKSLGACFWSSIEYNNYMLTHFSPMYLVFIVCLFIGIKDGLAKLSKTRSGIIPGIPKFDNTFSYLYFVFTNKA